MPIKTNCTQCNKELLIKPSRFKRQINCFCSIKCKSIYQKSLEPWNKGLKGVQKSHRKNISMIEEYGEEKALLLKKNLSKNMMGHKPSNKSIQKRIETIKKTGCISGKKNGMYGRTGKSNPNWKGGCSYWRKKYYQTSKYKKWHATVLKRDNYECKICGQKKIKKESLHVHHIKPFAKYPKLRTTLSNGITLCKKCHEYVHSKKYQVGQIKSIQKTSEKISMIDIEVEDNNNFFCNDILVHNSATAFRDDGKTPILFSILGEVIIKVSSEDLIKLGYLIKPTIKFYKIEGVDLFSKTYPEDYQNNVAENFYRNKLIVDLAKKYRHKKIIILTRFVNHGKMFKEMINGSEHIHGKASDREKVMQDFRDNKFNILIMTSSIGAEGLDIPDLDVIINASANKGAGRSIQILGRDLRTFKGKIEAIYIDFIDIGKHTSKHSEARISAFQAEGHDVEVIE